MFCAFIGCLKFVNWVNIKMGNQENKIKHLELIESIIERMAKNCFQLKAWSMTLVTVVGALSSKESDKRFILLAFIPIIVFWLLDAYYLQQERRYKALYRIVCQKKEADIDFNLNTRGIKYTEYESKRICFFYCLISTSVSLFYGVLTFTLILLVLVIFKGWCPWFN